jgi:SAM-dependent methyltransferase
MMGAGSAAWDEKYQGRPASEALVRISNAGRAGVVRAVLPLIQPGGRVLEAGSGTGRLVTHVALERGARGVGIDYAWQANVGSQQVAREVGADATFVSGDLSLLPFPDDFFDLVFSDSVIEHLPNPPGAVAEMARVVRPGGWVVVTTPNKLRPDGWDLYRLRYRPKYLQRSFFPWQLGRMLETCGLAVEHYFGDTLVLPRNFRLPARRPAAGNVTPRGGVTRPSWGLYWRLERAAARVLPSTMWVNIGVVGRKGGRGWLQDRR